MGSRDSGKMTGAWPWVAAVTVEAAEEFLMHPRGKKYKTHWETGRGGRGVKSERRGGKQGRS